MGVCGKCPARLGGQSRRGASRPARPSPGGADPGPEPRSPSARRPRARPLSPMLLFGLLLLTSALAGQRPGTRAESNLSSKLQLASNKEQNGESPPAPSPARFPRRIVHPGGMHPGPRWDGRLRACSQAPAFGGSAEFATSGAAAGAPAWRRDCLCGRTRRGDVRGAPGNVGASVPCKKNSWCQSSKFKNCL